MLWSNGWAALPCFVLQLVRFQLEGQIQLLKETDVVNEPKNGLAKTLLQTDVPVAGFWVQD